MFLTSNERKGLAGADDVGSDRMQITELVSDQGRANSVIFVRSEQAKSLPGVPCYLYFTVDEIKATKSDPWHSLVVFVELSRDILGQGSERTWRTTWRIVIG